MSVEGKRLYNNSSSNNDEAVMASIFWKREVDSLSHSGQGQRGDREKGESRPIYACTHKTGGGRRAVHVVVPTVH